MSASFHFSTGLSARDRVKEQLTSLRKSSQRKFDVAWIICLHFVVIEKACV